jgi:hypothetical protein
MKPTMMIRNTFAAALLFTVPFASAKPARISFAGGDGSSIEKAVVIKGGTEETGVAAEYDYLAKHYTGYKVGQQSLQASKGRSYDVIEFTTRDGKTKTIFFDISAFFGK